MIAAVHVVPAAGVEADRDRSVRGQHNGAGIAHVALCTADKIDGPADLVLIAVPAGHGTQLAAQIGART